MTKGIRWQIAFPYVLLILVVMVGLGWYFTDTTRKTYLDDLDRELSKETLLFSYLIKEELVVNHISPSGLDEMAHDWSQYLDKRVTIIQANGEVIGESQDDRRQYDNHIGRPEIIQAQQTGEGVITRFSQTQGGFWMYHAVAVKDGDEIVGYVRLSLALARIEAQISRLQRTLVGATILIALAAVVLAVWIADRSMQPLRRLTHAVSQISTETRQVPQLGGEIDQLGIDEIGELTHAFNAMSIRLNEQISALKSEQGKIEAVLKKMTDGLLIVDEQGLIQLINPAAAEMFKIRAEQALHQSLAVALRRHQIVELWQRCRDSQKTQYARLDLGAGQQFLHGTATSLEQALPGNTLLLFQDLTRMHLLETIRQDFVSNISHELGTPLASIKALVQNLQDHLSESPSPARRFFDKLNVEVDILNRMADRLLKLSQLDSGEINLNLELSAPQALLEKAAARLEILTQQAEVTIQIEVEPDCPSVLVDPVQFRQVLRNILRNAIKFSPKGGEILAKARRSGDQVLFSIQDNGPGIPAVDLFRIFERFYKSDRSRSGGGPGLGLSISKHLVEAHKGKIWAESVEGQGATFYISLPAA